jgi:hypothetical protein
MINYSALSVSVFNWVYTKVIYWKLFLSLVRFDMLIVVAQLNGAGKFVSGDITNIFFFVSSGIYSIP